MSKVLTTVLLVIALMLIGACIIPKIVKDKPKEVLSMATLSETFYGWTSNEIWEMRLSGTWATLRNVNFGAYPTFDPDATEDAIHAGHDGVNTYTISRVFTGFDFASHGLGAHAVIHSARLVISGYSLASASKIVACPSSYTPDMLAFDQPNTYSSWSAVSYGVNDFDWQTGDYNTIHLNSAGIDYLNTALKAESVCKFALLDHTNDFLNVAPIDGDVNKAGMRFASEVVTADRMRLEIDYFLADISTGSGSFPIQSFTFDDATRQAEFYNDSGTWSQKIAASDATNYVQPSNALYFQADDSQLNRVFLKFPIEDFPTGMRALAGTHVNVASESFGLDSSGETIRLELFEGTFDDRDFSSSTLDMYNDFGATSFFSKTWDTDGADSGTDQEWELNASGLVALNVALSTQEDFKLVVRGHWDMDNTTPSNSADSPQVWFDAYGYGNKYNQPYLELVLGLPVTQIDCEAGGWFWYSSACYNALPSNQEDCEALGSYWYNSKCNPNLPTTDTECSGYLFYWYYGECQNTNKIGVVDCQCIDVNNNVWLVAGHEVKAIDEVFVSTETSREPRLRTTGFTKTADYVYTGGLDGKIAVITFTDNAPDPQSDTVRCNVRGIMDGTDTLIENPISQLEHFLTTYLGLTSDEYNTVAFGAAETIATTRLYETGGVIENAKKAKSVIQEMSSSWDLTPYFDRDGKLNVKFLN